MDIKLYGADWCIDCRVMKNFLDKKELDYQYIDITKDKTAVEIIKKINNGKKIIPTVIINGISYSNPGILNLSQIIR
tara:strand:- start:1317 stop:1547 length:231 start_codon:yes stop_codon:yes gene_type:complete